MRDITLEELLEAGCHFGHQVNRRNPRADDYIYEERNNVHIINLEKTREGLLRAADVVKNLATEGKTLLIVGTKRQAESIIKEEIEKANKSNASEGLYYITSRWIGGVLTNFSEVSKNFKKLKEITDLITGRADSSMYTKRELTMMAKEREKLLGFYEGVQDLERIPDAVFIIDTHNEKTAVAEATTTNTTTIGITDTNADPSSITYSIPSNDDAVGALKLIISYIVDAWVEGKTSKSKEVKESKTEEPKSEVKKEKIEKAKVLSPKKPIKEKKVAEKDK